MKIKIGCLTYVVKEIDEQLADARDIYGNINHNEQVISLRKNLSKERRKEVLLHEVMHGICNQWLDLKTEEEEKFVEAVSYGLACVFRDNPKLKDAI